MRPLEVDLSLEVEPARRRRFRGRVGMRIRLEGRRRWIELHAAGLRLGRVRARALAAEGPGRWLRVEVEPRPERERVRLHPEAPLPAGEAELEIAFSGPFRRDLRGPYWIESAGGRSVVTQLAPTHARRLFPCFDEPDAKARFRLEVTTDPRHTVLANTSRETLRSLDDGRVTHVFARTPPLSSYLLALAVGDFEGSPSVFAGETEIRVWHVPGKKGLCDFALETARECLGRLESWFDGPYPYDKLDLVAVPDFEYGAMENPGAVFFREALLLLDPERATSAERRRAAEVICHELAHMWYGNLVTMAWWDDLWLNEAFATWMAFEIVDRWQPDWRMWQVFQQHRAAALDLDALAHTHPVYTPVRSADEATANFDLITYEKGASVVRMIERFLGPEIFCAGVRKYLRRHRESNATAADLWRALAEVSGERVDRVVRPWIEQEGFPLVRIRRRTRDGEARLSLYQERFSLRPARDAGARWPIPWVARVADGPSGGSHLLRHLFERRREEIPADGADLGFVYGNADEGAFLRPHHDREEEADLLADLPQLTPVERMGFVDHQWALVRAGRVGMDSLLDLLAAVGADPEPGVLEAARLPLGTLCRRLAPDLGPEVEARLRAWVEIYYGAQFDELGWQARRGESAARGERRGLVLDLAGRIGRSERLLAEAGERCRAHLAGGPGLAPDIADPVVSMAAVAGDTALHDAYVAALRDAGTPQEQRRFLLALADFEDPDAVARTLALVRRGEVAAQDLAFLFERLFANRAAREPAWDFLRRYWSRLAPRAGGHSLNRIVSATPALASARARREVAAFFREHPVPGGRRALRQALERLDWYRGYRRRAGPQLRSYLDL